MVLNNSCLHLNTQPTYRLRRGFVNFPYECLYSGPNLRHGCVERIVNDGPLEAAPELLEEVQIAGYTVADTVIAVPAWPVRNGWIQLGMINPGVI